MADPIVESGHMLACDVEKYGPHDEMTQYECDLHGDMNMKEDVPVGDLKIQGQYSPSNIRTGQATRHTDRDIEIGLEGATCGFGMSGWGGILQCSD